MHKYLNNLPQLALRAALGLFTATLIACGGGDVSSPATPGGITANDRPVEVQLPPILSTLPVCTVAVPAAAPLRDISAIQGTGSVSTMVSQTVTVRGVVVGDAEEPR